MMDIWLLFGLFKPFIDIILQTYIETLRAHEAKDGDKDFIGDISKTAWQNRETSKINDFKYTISFIKDSLMYESHILDQFMRKCSKSL